MHWLIEEYAFVIYCSAIGSIESSKQVDHASFADKPFPGLDSSSARSSDHHKVENSVLLSGRKCAFDDPGTTALTRRVFEQYP